MNKGIVLLFSQRTSPNFDLSYSSSLVMSIPLPGGVLVMAVNFMTVCFCVAAVALAISWGYCVVLSLAVMGMDH